MKLEIKHLAPYLPYELKGQLIGYPKGTTVTMGTFLSNQQKMWTIDMFQQNEVFPILKPLSKLSNEELIREKYQGIRPAPGYAACPEHTEKQLIWDLLDTQKNTGMKLTESYAMWPGAAVSGFYFSHPQHHHLS